MMMMSSVMIMSCRRTGGGMFGDGRGWRRGSVLCGVNASFMHGQLTLLRKASITELASEAFAYVGMDADSVPWQIVTRRELLATLGTHETSLALMLNGVVFDQRVLPRKWFVAIGLHAFKASRASGGMHFRDVPLQFTAAAKCGFTYCT